MTVNLDAWGRSVESRLIDRDGAYGAQCWDLAADWAERGAGCPLRTFWTLSNPSSPDDTLASSMWLHWPVKPDIVKYFTRHGRDEAIRAGDIPIWARSRPFPASHIAVALGPATAAGIPCMTQNPGASRREVLTTAGLLGFLRPINAQPPQRKDDDMPVIIQTDKGDILVVDHARGTYWNVHEGIPARLVETRMNWLKAQGIQQLHGLQPAALLSGYTWAHAAPGAPAEVAKLDPSEVERIAEAVADEQSRRLRE